MASFNDVPIVSAPSPDGGARRVVRWLCTSNPFYVLSAGLFLAGLRISFSPATKEVETWALVAGLASYTLLLAITAFLLVRFCRVWDDARTVLLLVVLMFLATSVTFDELLISNPDLGAGCYLGGLLFAVVLSEGLLFGMRLRLPLVFRIPYYLILALFFLYPLLLGQLQAEEHSEDLMWGLFGFSAVAGAVFLTLLPAIRQGAESVRANGSPWPWPFYPWALFVMLGLAVPVRALLLCFSMHQPNDPYLYDRLIFGPYFLVPFGLALAVLLLEVGLVSSRRGLQGLAMFLPLGLILVAMVGHRSDPIYEDFIHLFFARLGGDPLFLTLLALVVFYSYAALRSVPAAVDALTGVLLALAVVGPQSLTQVAFHPPQALPILAAALVQIVLGHWRRRSWRCLAGSVGLVAGSALVWPGPVVFHLGVLAMLLIGAAFEDGLARFLRRLGSTLVVLACLAALFVPLDEETLPREMQEGYPLILATFLAVYGRRLNDRVVLVLAGLILTVWLAVAGGRGYSTLRLILKGLDYLALSLGLFVLALLISLDKAGVLTWRQWRRWFVTWFEFLRA